MRKITLVDEIASETLGSSIVYEVPEGEETVNIGRGDHNHVTIPHRGYRESLTTEKREVLDSFGDTISAFHCELHQKSGKKPYIRDRTSKNRSRIGTQEIGYTQCAPIYDGAKLRLGKYKLTIRIEE